MSSRRGEGVVEWPPMRRRRSLGWRSHHGGGGVRRRRRENASGMQVAALVVGMAACRVSAQVDQLRVLVPLYARPEGGCVSAFRVLLAMSERRCRGSQSYLGGGCSYIQQTWALVDGEGRGVAGSAEAERWPQMKKPTGSGVAPTCWWSEARASGSLSAWLHVASLCMLEQRVCSC